MRGSRELSSFVIRCETSFAPGISPFQLIRTSGREFASTFRRRRTLVGYLNRKPSPWLSDTSARPPKKMTTDRRLALLSMTISTRAIHA